MILLIRIIVTSPFATKRLPDLPPFNSLMGKDSLAMLMIKVSGKVLPFNRMIIGRIPIIWLDKNVLLIEAADEFATYGRRAGKAHEGVKMVSITRRAALHYSEITARDFEKMGECPFSSGYYLIFVGCLLYTSPSPRDVEESRMPSSA